MEPIFRFSVGEILRKMHAEASFSDMEQQELMCYLRCNSRQKIRECIEWVSPPAHPLVVLPGAPSPFSPFFFPFPRQTSQESFSRDL